MNPICYFILFFFFEQELLDTERSYVQMMGYLLDDFRTPLIESKLVPMDVVKKIFLNVETIFQLHAQQLLAPLEVRLASLDDPKEGSKNDFITAKGNKNKTNEKENTWNSKTSLLADIFIDFFPFAKIYSFVSHFTKLI